MTNQPFPRKSLHTPRAVVQQSIIQQAQAAAAAQIAPTNSTGQEALLQDTDLTKSGATEEDLPPPAYGDIYGEISHENDGLGTTSARVTNDGRVNIRINQLNRRLSQIFTPALDQHVQNNRDSRLPPAPYIPPSLGGEEGVPPPPSLNIVIQVVGSRGDVQPFVALGKVLKDTYGHRVRLATHPNFKNFVQENGLEFFSIGGDPSRLMAFMVKNPSLMPGFRSLLSGDVSQRRKDVAEYIQGCWRSCYRTGDGMSARATDAHLSEPSGDDRGSELTARPFVADCIIANPPSFAHIHCAEKLGIPLHIMFTMPYSPTQAFPHPLANIQSSNADPQLTNYVSYAMIELLAWQGLGDIINRFRAKCLGLDPVSLIWAPGMLQRLKIPHTYCWSPSLIPKPKDWGPHISISGFFFLNLASDYTPTPELQAFLNAGPPPVYIGFGSIVLDDPNAMTELIFEAARKSGQRVLLSKGWGGMGADELCIPDNVFMLGNVPHDWLFKQVSCVVHHGGAGTTAAGITAGRPTLVVPFFGDQPFWGAMVARAGAGPDPIPHKKLTADSLADAINFCLKPESLERAKELARKIAAERGSDMGARSFHQHLEADRLRCVLIPSRAAIWRIKRTQVRLSAFAACTLANADLLDFHELKLFRPQEHYTDEGPWDPVSGGLTAALRAFNGMALGVAESPSETVKALYMPSAPSRQQPHTSVSTISMESENPTKERRSASLFLRQQSQTSLGVQEPLARLRSSPSPSGPSSRSPNLRSNSMSDALQNQLSPKLECTSQYQVHSQNISDLKENRDMLRQTGVHTSNGLGRFVRAFVQAPMEISVNITKGFHNLPKLWGDDTVRPQERVSDFKSGMKAVGKEFGFGWYDGVTGLITQPVKGAQQDGSIGFIKGIGKGLGGFVTKPNAAMMSVFGYTMKGVHKEVQKLFGSNVQSYIVASRVAQGYEEWLQSSDAEKEDVIARWKLIQKHLKKKAIPDEMLREFLETQQNDQLSTSAATLTQDPILAESDPQTLLCTTTTGSDVSQRAADTNGSIRMLAQRTPPKDADEDADLEQAIVANMSQLQRQQQETADHQADRENLRHVMASSETEAKRQANEAMEYEEQLKRVMAESLREHRQRWSDSEQESDMDVDDREEEGFGLARESPKSIAKEAAAKTLGSPGVHQPPSQDQGHLAGITQGDFEAQRQRLQGDKTTQEKTEEEIVLAYARKQSLVEMHHRNKGKGRDTATDDMNYEELQKVLESSMRRF